MYEIIHGGDIYRRQVTVDFSVNINPLGIPWRVKEALIEAVAECDAYPDIHAAGLVEGIGRHMGVDSDMVVCGNGASELFMAIIHAQKPRRVLIPVPSFYGYERAAAASGAMVTYYEMGQANGFALTEAFLEMLTEDIDMLFLANPNNPVGNLLDGALLERILDKCEENRITLVLDECFIEFTERESVARIYDLRTYPHAIVVRAFTKIYAIPGVRLGYLLCGNEEMKEQIRTQIPEWNLSCFAQRSGAAALEETDYCRKSVACVAKEREYLTKALQRYGIKVWRGTANFLLIQSEYPLYEALLEQGILIRDCSNFRGLGKGYYRIAVKAHRENEMLMEMAGEIIEADRIYRTKGY